MAKFIDVNITLNKTIKVDSDNLDEALNIVENEYPQLELTSEWLNARNVELRENLIISSSSERLAELYKDDFNRQSLEELLDMVFGKTEIRDYIYNETLDILSNQYHINISDKNI